MGGNPIQIQAKRGDAELTEPGPPVQCLMSVCRFWERNQPMPTDQEYWEALQARVCAKCLDGDGKGACFIAQDRECAMKKYFPQILEAVNSMYSPSITPYVEQLRSRICAACAHQTPAGVCTLRNEVECALDRYFPLIVQVIEEVQWHRRIDKTQ